LIPPYLDPFRLLLIWRDDTASITSNPTTKSGVHH
jgi:hypothetical protein